MFETRKRQLATVRAGLPDREDWTHEIWILLGGSRGRRPAVRHRGGGRRRVGVRQEGHYCSTAGRAVAPRSGRPGPDKRRGPIRYFFIFFRLFGLLRRLRGPFGGATSTTAMLANTRSLTLGDGSDSFNSLEPQHNNRVLISGIGCLRSGADQRLVQHHHVPANVRHRINLLHRRPGSPPHWALKWC